MEKILSQLNKIKNDFMHDCASNGLKENSIIQLYDSCWDLLDRFSSDVLKYSSSDFSTFKKIKEHLYIEIMYDFYIYNGGFSPKFVSADMLLNSCTKGANISTRTFSNHFQLLKEENPYLYNKIITYNLVSESTKEGSRLRYNNLFPYELIFLQKNYKSLDFFPNFLLNSSNITQIENNLHVLDDLASKTNHNRLLYHYINSNYNLDYYYFALYNINSYIEHKIFNKDGSSSNTSYQSYSNIFMYNLNNIATYIASIIPFSILRYYPTKYVCMYYSSFEKKTVLTKSSKKETRDYTERLYPKLEVFAFSEFFISNAFFYLLDSVKDCFINSTALAAINKNLIDKEGCSYKDFFKTYTDLRSMINKYEKNTSVPYSAETFFHVLIDSTKQFSNYGLNDHSRENATREQLESNLCDDKLILNYSRDYAIATKNPCSY